MSDRSEDSTVNSQGPTDEELIRRALVAAVEGPYFPEWEFHALFGLSRDELRIVLDAWPSEPGSGIRGYEDGAAVRRVGVNNALNNLLGYPHGHDQQLLDEVGVGRQELALVLARWREEAFDPGASGYFDRLM